MGMLKRTAQALAGLAAAFAAALAVGTWLLPEERDALETLGGFRLSVSGIGAGLSLLTALAFASGWIGSAGRRNGAGGGAGRAWNGIGFGLLPGIAVWKIFERRTALAQGAKIPEAFGNGWLFGSAGRWLPVRAEILLAAALFGAAVIWLLIRKRELPENGDLAGVSAALWGSARMVTEGLRADPGGPAGEISAAGWLAAGVMALTLAWWTARALREKRKAGYAAACVPVFLLSVAGIALIQNQILQTGVPAADLAGQICFSLLALKAVLCMGRVSR